jgi:hypothetical protein
MKEPSETDPIDPVASPSRAPTLRKGLMIAPGDRRGYTQLEAVCLLKPDAEGWEPFTRDVLNMPISMLPAIQYAVKAKRWQTAIDPLGQVRRTAENWAGRQARTQPSGRSSRNV